MIFFLFVCSIIVRNLESKNNDCVPNLLLIFLMVSALLNLTRHLSHYVKQNLLFVRMNTDQ